MYIFFFSNISTDQIYQSTDLYACIYAWIYMIARLDKLNMSKHNFLERQESFAAASTYFAFGWMWKWSPQLIEHMRIPLVDSIKLMKNSSVPSTWSEIGFAIFRPPMKEPTRFFSLG